MHWLWNSIAEAATPEVDWLTRAGSIGILAWGIVAFMRGWIVSGSSCKTQLDEMRAQRDKALELVYKQAEISQKALEVGERGK